MAKKIITKQDKTKVTTPKKPLGKAKKVTKFDEAMAGYKLSKFRKNDPPAL